MSTVISPQAQIGAKSLIGNNVIIHDDVVIGDNVTIEDNSIIGYNNLTRIHDARRVFPKLTIGAGSKIGAGAIFYRGSKLGNYITTEPGVLIREGMQVGDYSVIGAGVMLEGYSTIGSYCIVRAQSHIAPFTTLEDYVSLGCGVVTMNDPAAAHYRPHLLKASLGPTLRRGASVDGGGSLLPDVVIGEEALVGPGSMVMRNVPKLQVWSGDPLRKIRMIAPEEVPHYQN